MNHGTRIDKTEGPKPAIGTIYGDRDECAYICINTNPIQVLCLNNACTHTVDVDLSIKVSAIRTQLVRLPSGTKITIHVSQ